MLDTVLVLFLPADVYIVLVSRVACSIMKAKRKVNLNEMISMGIYIIVIYTASRIIISHDHWDVDGL